MRRRAVADDTLLDGALMLPAQLAFQPLELDDALAPTSAADKERDLALRCCPVCRERLGNGAIGDAASATSVRSAALEYTESWVANWIANRCRRAGSAVMSATASPGA